MYQDLEAMIKAQQAAVERIAAEWPATMERIRVQSARMVEDAVDAFKRGVAAHDAFCREMTGRASAA